ncbi:uncharacterized protein LOC129903372 [Solanum dulcamara]|uniref:uncharacterized protein LOC129903372 n=1 Tax=Solanum dulcamara TaxID=45834 RepID=UPI0024850721|nr:uncharacterized protein LOC129903372 [Solanum dulcamara]
MGLISFILISAKILLSCSFWIFCRPSVTLLCPLYASIRAIESDTESRYQKCLQYWVLFGLTTVLEFTLAKPLTGFSLWHYAKGLASLLLVLPQFGVASYVYMNFVKPCLSPNPCIENVTEKNECMPMELCSDYIDAAPRHLEQDEKDNLQSFVVYEAESSPSCHRTIHPKKVQMEWSCALCLVSASSEKGLKQHIKGKKHKLKEDEERKHEMIMASIVAKFASKLEGSYLTDLLESLNHLKSLKFVELRGFNLPIRRPFRYCTWRKPEPGWIKLNTDGSIDRKRAGLGGLLRDYEGVAICACVSEVPCDDIFLVELLAIWRGLTLAVSIGIKRIWVESDSMSAVKAINKQQPHNQKAASCLQHIWKMLNKFQKYQVTHSWRETNRAADYLSKMDILGSDIVMWPTDFHKSLCKIIAEDAQGSVYLRR